MTEHVGKENLAKDTPASKTLFGFESFVFVSILNQTCCQIEQIGNIAFMQGRLWFIWRLAW